MQEILVKNGSTPLKRASTLAELIKRPELDYECLAELDPDRVPLDPAVIEQVNINLKYEG